MIFYLCYHKYKNNSLFINLNINMEIKKLKRPQTPHVEIGNGTGIVNSKNQKDNIFKNFSNLMKQIIDNQNDNFLNGDIHLIDYLLAKYLNITVEEISKLDKISIRINGDYGLLNQFGERLKNLSCLKLNGSFIQSISDIGTNFKNLKILQVNDCKLKDLSGIICFESLEVLEAKNNQIEDLIELEMCSSIQKLNLGDNKIEKEENILFLGNLDKLTWINLKGNPITGYEAKLKELIPTLESIDVSDNDNSTLNVTSSVSISNISNSTNENSPIIPDGKKTKNDFCKGIKFDDETKPELISISKEINMNKTMTSFNVNKNIIKGGTQLKPIIKKKEENTDIKILRHTFRNTNNNKFIETPNQSNILFNSINVSANRRKLEKLKLKKDKEPIKLTGNVLPQH